MIHKMSQIGAIHASTGGENQDAVCYGESKNYSVISLADGVSACSRAKSGAIIASSAATNLFLKKGDHFLEFSEKQIADYLLSHILFELRQQAEKDEKELEAYSSTISSILVDKKNQRMLCINLGDCIILGIGNGRCRVLAAPSDSSSGCCTTTTTAASLMLTVRMMDSDPFDSVVICSDGAWRPMFTQNRLRSDISDWLKNQDYDSLESYLLCQELYDDCTFISLSLRDAKGRRSV